jgi:hypothetical protein
MVADCSAICDQTLLTATKFLLYEIRRGKRVEQARTLRLFNLGPETIDVGIDSVCDRVLTALLSYVNQ